MMKIKRMIPALLILCVSCSKSTESNTPTGNTLIGKWQAIQSYMSPGDAGSWTTITNGDTLTVHADSTYQFARNSYFTGTKATGIVSTNQSNLYFIYYKNTMEKDSVNLYSLVLKKDTLELWNKEAIEGAATRYKRIK